MKLKLHHMHHLQFSLGAPQKSCQAWKQWVHENKYILHGCDDEKTIIIIYDIPPSMVWEFAPIDLIACGWRPMHTSSIKIVSKQKP